jgi:acyl carrier protein
MEIRDRIKAEIQNVAFTSVADDDALLEQGLLDSVSAVDLAVALEDAFGVSIPFVDINKQHFHSVATIEAYLRRKMP